MPLIYSWRLHNYGNKNAHNTAGELDRKVWFGWRPLAHLVVCSQVKSSTTTWKQPSWPAPGIDWSVWWSTVGRPVAVTTTPTSCTGEGSYLVSGGLWLCCSWTVSVLYVRPLSSVTCSGCVSLTSVTCSGRVSLACLSTQMLEWVVLVCLVRIWSKVVGFFFLYLPSCLFFFFPSFIIPCLSPFQISSFIVSLLSLLQCFLSNHVFLPDFFSFLPARFPSTSSSMSSFHPCLPSFLPSVFPSISSSMPSFHPCIPTWFLPSSSSSMPSFHPCIPTWFLPSSSSSMPSFHPCIPTWFLPSISSSMPSFHPCIPTWFLPSSSSSMPSFHPCIPTWFLPSSSSSMPSFHPCIPTWFLPSISSSVPSFLPYILSILPPPLPCGVERVALYLCGVGYWPVSECWTKGLMIAEDSTTLTPSGTSSTMVTSWSARWMMMR